MGLLGVPDLQRVRADCLECKEEWTSWADTQRDGRVVVCVCACDMEGESMVFPLSCAVCLLKADCVIWLLK